MNNEKEFELVTLMMNETISFLASQATKSVVEIIIESAKEDIKEAGVGFATRSLSDIDTVFTDAIDVVMIKENSRKRIVSIPIIANSKEELNAMNKAIAQTINDGIKMMCEEHIGIKAESYMNEEAIKKSEKLFKKQNESTKTNDIGNKILDFTGSVKH